MIKPIGYYNYSVIATYASLAAASAGIYFACVSGTSWAVLCLMASGLLDMVDGRIAGRCRRSRDEKRFGIQIDSLCDLVAFGVLPVCIMLNGTQGVFPALCSSFYILCALVRMAYFNVDEEKRQDALAERRQYYFGMPVTSAALAVPLVYSLMQLLGDAYGPVYMAMLTLLGAAFITNIKVPKPGLRGSVLLIVLGIVETAAVIISGLHRF